MALEQNQETVAKQNGHNAVRKANENLGGRWEMGQKSERWNVRCAQKMTRRGGAGKGSGSEDCRGAEHGQACTKDRTGAVALRTAIESAVQLGQGDEVNRQSEMANLSKCRDSLQVGCREYNAPSLPRRAMNNAHAGPVFVLSLCHSLASIFVVLLLPLMHAFWDCLEHFMRMESLLFHGPYIAYMDDKLVNGLFVPPNTQAALKCYATGF
jgi:hypothetical protein